MSPTPPTRIEHLRRALDDLDTNASQGGGMGLRSMRYRAEVIGAKLSLETNELGGTTLMCVFNGEPIPDF